MDEYVHLQYLREEEFLEDYFGTVEAALPLLPRPWRPNYRCDGRVRWQRYQLLLQGRLDELTFDSAVIFRGAGRFTSICLYFRSSRRFVVVRIPFVPGDVLVETLADVGPAVGPGYCPCRPQSWAEPMDARRDRFAELGG